MIVWDSPVMNMILSDEPDTLPYFTRGTKGRMNAVDPGERAVDDAKHDERVEARRRGWRPVAEAGRPCED